MAIKIHEIKDIILVTRNSFCFQSIPRTTIVFNLKKTLSHIPNHLKTNQTLFKIIQRKVRVFLRRKLQVFFSPTKNPITLLLKAMITHQYHDRFLINVDLKKF
jgi:hypothetical protein